MALQENIQKCSDIDAKSIASSGGNSVIKRGVAQQQTLILLHGWGFNSAAFSSSIPVLKKYFTVITVDLPGYSLHGKTSNPIDEEQWQEQLLTGVTGPCIVLGWSLGFDFAIRLAGRYPEKIAALVSVNANPCFVARTDWPCAMPAEQFAVFRELANEPPAVNPSVEEDNGSVATLTSIVLHRFAALVAKNNLEQRKCARFLRGMEQATLPVLQQGLQMLLEQDYREPLSTVTQPVLHLLSSDDALVPAELFGKMRSLYPAHTVEQWRGGHAPFIAQEEPFAQRLNSFAQSVRGDSGRSVMLDKRWMARSFSEAAQSYDAVAHLQRRVGDLLLDNITAFPICDEENVLDLGSGTGTFSQQLMHALNLPDYSSALLSLDIAEGMLRYARDSHVPKNSDGPSLYLCADAEQLPIDANKVKAIYSNLALQWCDVGRAFAECYRVLEPGGELVFSTLGPATLQELRSAWATVDDYVHVNRFQPVELIREEVQKQGLQLTSCERQMLVVRYDRFLDLAVELKALGAHNVNTGRSKGLTGRAGFRKLSEAYEQFRDEQQQLPASYEVILIRARKP